MSLDYESTQSIIDEISRIISTHPEDSIEFLGKYAAHIAYKNNFAIEEAMRIAKSNIGYLGGNFSFSDREIIENLFNCEHPIFGKIKYLGSPSQEECFQCGYYGKSLEELRGISKDKKSIKMKLAYINKPKEDGS